MQALLGTETSASINLVAQLIIIIGLWVGFYFARTGQIPKHRNTQTILVLANLLFIALFMATSFYNYVVSGATTTGTVATLMMVHGFLGLVAQLSGIYLILRMRTQFIPQRFRVRNFKLMMRATLGLWTVIVLLGLGIYYERFLTPSSAVAEVQMDQFKRAGQDLVIHASETQEALQRGNLQTAQRHSEHLVNLIEGNRGGNYGDLDRDGTVEDPGDGTGLFIYLKRFTSGSKQLQPRAKQLEESLKQINRDALAIAAAKDLAAASAPAQRIVELALDANNEGVVPIEKSVRDTGVPSVAAQAPSAVSGDITITIERFRNTPMLVRLSKGTTVMWVNKESPRHTVTSDDGIFHSGSMVKEDTFSFTFNQVGTFKYYCRFHGDKGGVDMAGTVIVE